MEIQLTAEQKIIYDLVSNSKKQGITKANLNKKSGLNPKEVDKIIKLLETRDKIKSARPNGRTTGNKLWIDFNEQLENNLQQTTFTSENGETNEELIEKIKQKIIYHLQQQQNFGASLDELKRVYKSFQSEHYDEKDFLRIMDLLKFDSILKEEQNSFFILNQFRQQDFHFYMSYLPCQSCPVFDKCKPGNTISPENCVFQW